MSFHSITIDELMKLSQKTLQFALRIFQQELDGTIALLVEQEGARTDEQVLDDLNHLLTLRKVFAGRLEELAAEESETAPLLAAQQYELNERQPLAA